MKKLIVAALLGFLSIDAIIAQDKSVGINVEPSQLNANAVLQLVSPDADQGLLIPQLEESQINAMATNLTPDEKGLMVFNVTRNIFMYWDGTSWRDGLGVLFQAEIVDGEDLQGPIINPIIKPGAVDEENYASNSVSNRALADNAVATRNLQNDAVTTAKIQGGAVTFDKLQSTLSSQEAGQYGNEFSVVQLTVDEKGRVTGLSNVTILIDSTNIKNLSLLGEDIAESTIPISKIDPEGNTDKVLAIDENGNVTWIDQDVFTNSLAGDGLSEREAVLDLDLGDIARTNSVIDDNDIIAIYDNINDTTAGITRQNLIESAPITNINVDGGQIDGTVIGANQAASASVTDLAVTAEGINVQSGNVEITDSVSVGNALDVDGPTTLDHLTVDTNDGDLAVSGAGAVSLEATDNDVSVSTINTGDINLNAAGDVNISGTNVGISGSFTPDNLEVDGLTLLDQTQINTEDGEFQVIGSVNGMNIDVPADFAEQVDLAASGTSTNVRGDLNVAEQATFNDNVDANSGLDIDGADLNVATNANIGGNNNVTGNLNVSGISDLAGETNLGSTGVQTTVRGNLQVDETSNFSDAVTVDNTLDVNQLATFNNGLDLTSGDLNINNNLDVDGSLDVAGQVFLGNNGGVTTTIRGNLVVDEDVTLANPGINTTVQGDLTVNESAEFNDDVNIAGNTTLDILDVDGQSNLDATEINTDDGQLLVTGDGSNAATFEVPVNIDATLEVLNGNTVNLGDDQIQTNEIEDLQITNDKIANQTIVAEDKIAPTDRFGNPLENRVLIIDLTGDTDWFDLGTSNLLAADNDGNIVRKPFSDFETNDLPEGFIFLGNSDDEATPFDVSQQRRILIGQGGGEILSLELSGDLTISDISGVTTIQDTAVQARNIDAQNIPFAVSGTQIISFTTSSNSGADDIQLNATSGEVDITAATLVDVNAATFEMDVTGGVSIDADATSNFSTTTGDIDIEASDELDLDAGSGVTIDAGAASNFTTTSGALTLTAADLLDLDGGSGVVIEANANDVDITADQNVNISGTNGNINLDASNGAVSLDAGAASNFTTTAGTITLNGADGVNINSNASEVDITTTGPVDINGSATTVDGTTIDVTGTDDISLSMNANDAGLKSISINAANAGSGNADVDINADNDINLNAGGAVNISGTIGLENLTVTNETNLNGNSNIGNEATDIVDITGITNINSGNLTIDAPQTDVNSTSLNISNSTTTNINSDAINLGNAAGDQTTVSGNLDATNGIDVTNAFLTVNDGTSDVFTVDNATGDTDISGTLNADGAATLGNTLQVTGNVDAENGLDVSGSDLTVSTNTDLNGDVDVAGTTTLNDAVDITGASTLTTGTGQVTFGGNVDADGGLDVTGTLQADDNIILGADDSDDLTINADATVSGDILGENALTFEGATDDDTNITTFTITDPTAPQTITFPDASGTVVLQGGSNYLGDLALSTDVNGDIVEAEEGQDFNVESQNINLGDESDDQITVSGNIDAQNGLDVTNAFLTVNDGTSDVFTVDNATGDTDISGTLNADGAATLGSTLQVAGNVDAENGLDVSGSDLTVATNTDLNGDVDVAGTTTLNDAVDITGASTLTTGTGQVTFGGNVDADAGLDVTGSDLTVGGTNLTIDVGTGDLSTAGSVDITNDLSFDAGNTANEIVTDAEVDLVTPSDNALVTETALASSIGGQAGSGLTYDNTSKEIDLGGDLTSDAIIGTNGNTFSIESEGSGAGINYLEVADGGNITIGDGTITTGAGQFIVGGNLDATNGVDITGAGLTVNDGTADVFTVDNATGDTDISGTLNADGAATLGSTLQVTGNVDAENGLDVSGSDLTVATNTDLNGDVDVAGTTTLNDAVDITGASTLTTGTGQVTFGGNVDADGGLDVTGSDLTVGGTNLTIDVGTGDLSTAGSVDITNNLSFDAGNTANEIVTDAEVDLANPSDNALVTETALASSIGGQAGSGLTYDNTSKEIDLGGDLTSDAIIGTNGNTFSIESEGSGAGINYFEVADGGDITIGDGSVTTGTGQFTIGGNLDATNGLDVTNAFLTVNDGTADVFTVDNATGNIVSSGNLNVDGITQLDQTFINTTDGAMLVSGTSGVSITQTDNTVLLRTLSSGNVVVNSVDDFNVFAGNEFNIEGSQSSGLQVSANEANNQTLTLNATNSGTGKGNISISADDSISLNATTINISGSFSPDNLDVNGLTQLDETQINTDDNPMVVTGSNIVNFNNTAGIQVANNADINGNLDVDGTTSTDGIINVGAFNNTGNANITGNLNITENFSFDGLTSVNRISTNLELQSESSDLATANAIKTYVDNEVSDKDLQGAYDAGNAITTVDGRPLNIDGGGKILLRTTNGAADALALDATSGRVDINAAGGVDINASNTSIFSVNSASLTFSTVGSGNLDLNSAANMNINAANNFNIDAMAVTFNGDVVLQEDIDVNGVTSLSTTSINTAVGDFSVAGSNKSTLSSTNGSADAVKLEASSGGVDIDGNTGVSINSVTGGILITGSDDIDLTATNININGNFNPDNLNVSGASSLNELSVNTDDNNFTVTGANGVILNNTGGIQVANATDLNGTLDVAGNSNFTTNVDIEGSLSFDDGAITTVDNIRTDVRASGSSDNSSLVTEDAVRDAIDAESANLQSELDDTQTGAGLGADGSYSANGSANYITGATDLADADDLLDARAKVVSDSIQTLQGELDASQSGAGLNADGGYTANGSANYINTATSLKNADDQLDTQVKANADAIANNNTALQTELDDTQTGAGLGADGSYSANSGTNFIDAATSLNDADLLLDTQLGSNTTDIGNLETLSGVAGATDLGTFTDGIITANSTIKTALQELETDLANQTDDQNAGEVSYDGTTSGLLATDVQGAIDEVDGNVDTNTSNISTNAGNISTNTTDIGNLETLSGVAGATDLGTFTDGIITANSTIKTALQELETDLANQTDDQNAGEVSYDGTTSGLSATDVQGAIDEVDGNVGTNTSNISTNTTDIGNLETLSGVAGATDLGTFTDGIITANSTIKTALQELETDLANQTDDQNAGEVSYDGTTSGLSATDVQGAIDEVDGNVDTNTSDISTNAGNISTNTTDIGNLETLSGVAGATDLGIFSGSTVSDNTDIKNALQELETAVESIPTPGLGDVLSSDNDAGSNSITGVDNLSAASITLGGVNVTSSAAELNLLDGVTATTTELNYVHVTTAGTAEANKALVTDANNDISGINDLSATNLTGTLQTASQTGITSVGTLTDLTVSGATNLTGAITLGDGATDDITLNGQFVNDPVFNSGTGTTTLDFNATGTNTITIPDASTTMVGTDLTQTLTNKTLNTPTLNNVSISGGSITGITDLAISEGGTGASTAEDARTNLGIGTIATQDATVTTPSDGDVLVYDASGSEFVNEAAIGFEAYRSSTTTTTSGAAIVFDSEDFDTNNAFNTTNGTYTIPKAGLYHLSVNVIVTYDEPESNYISLFVGSTEVARTRQVTTAGSSVTLTISKTLSLSQGDVLEIRYTDESSQNDDTLIGNRFSSYFSGHLIR